ncbi:hypothetical protein HPB50_021561 [Hyalomma asiaticum]|uniref:Uncharacterized protein n=1 Tax=Hyalomma asiaticum TaxID=266040 RepID=A0ACB7T337_HYAAI|nr:hypothetical protein HPB50_021561 [Hyalomma asiaticum]
MTDADAAASTGLATPIENSTDRKEDATDLSQKKTLDNGGWFTAKYHNSRLIAIPQAGSEAANKLAPSQPKRRKERLPPLPKTDFKVIIRPKNGLNISQLSTHQMACAITKACGNPNMCNRGVGATKATCMLIRLRNGSNNAIISAPNTEAANAVQSISTRPASKANFNYLLGKAQQAVGRKGLVILGYFNAWHKSWGYVKETQKGKDLAREADRRKLTLITDPTRPMRSIGRDSCPDLAFVRGVWEARSENEGETLGSDHCTLRILIETLPIRKRQGQARLTDWEAYRKIPINEGCTT